MCQSFPRNLQKISRIFVNKTAYDKTSKGDKIIAWKLKKVLDFEIQSQELDEQDHI